MAKKPDFEVSAISENGDKGRFTKVGVAFINRDQSINVILNALPVSGKLQLRVPRETETAVPTDSEGAE